MPTVSTGPSLRRLGSLGSAIAGAMLLVDTALTRGGATLTWLVAGAAVIAVLAGVAIVRQRLRIDATGTLRHRGLWSAGEIMLPAVTDVAVDDRQERMLVLTDPLDEQLRVDPDQWRDHERVRETLRWWLPATVIDDDVAAVLAPVTDEPTDEESADDGASADAASGAGDPQVQA